VKFDDDSDQIASIFSFLRNVETRTINGIFVIFASAEMGDSSASPQVEKLPR
jgi:hypothetical protein